MRIVAGKYKGRTLRAPEGSNTRPTSDRAREAIFNMLDSRLLKEGKYWQDLSVLDAFAGTGALGIEAASRGTKKIYFMEKDFQALTCLKENCLILEQDTSVFFFSDVLRPPDAVSCVDLLFMDPPYRQGLVTAGLDALMKKGWIDSETLCVIETEKSEQTPLSSSFKVLDERIYGKAKVLLASPN